MLSNKLLFNSNNNNKISKKKSELDKLPKEWENRNTSNMSTSDYTYSSLYNNNGNAPHNATINHPSTSTYHPNYYSTSYYPPYDQQLPHTTVNNNFAINNNNNIDERGTSDVYSLQCNQTQQYQHQQPQQFRADNTYNGVVGGEGYKMSSTATNWFRSDQSLATEQQSNNVMNIISMTSSR